MTYKTVNIERVECVEGIVRVVLSQSAGALPPVTTTLEFSTPAALALAGLIGSAVGGANGG